MFKGMERRSNQFVKIKPGAAPTRNNRPPLTEPDDMRRIDFACHPAEPVKVLESWSEPPHCLVCGSGRSLIGTRISNLTTRLVVTSNYEDVGRLASEIAAETESW